jgi:CRP-like cAMP-binding protein
MISPELLRRYPCFAGLDESQLRCVAEVAVEAPCGRGTILFREDEPAEKLFLLQKGSVDLYFTIQGKPDPGSAKRYAVGEINAGEIFGLPALLEPYLYHAMAQVGQDGACLQFDAAALRALLRKDDALGKRLMHQVALALMQRLRDTRIQLAAARA